VVPVQLCKLVAVANVCSNRWRDRWQICENGINFIGRSLEYVLQKLPSGAPVCLLKALFYGKLNHAIDAEK
jgi:hypothetical protein